jgi:small GTP-binding protein
MSTNIRLKEPTFDICIKCVFIGDAGVGKSSIITRYVNHTFSDTTFSTIGVDFCVKYVLTDKYKVKLQIWDLAGQTNYRSIARSYYRNAEILFFVFDKKNRETFTNFNNWINDFRHRLDDIHLVIVGNKCETIISGVHTDEAINLANEYNAQYYETSARDNININEIFENTVRLIQEKKKTSAIITSINAGGEPIVLGNTSNNSKYNCCSGINVAPEVTPWTWLGSSPSLVKN